jgi:hypothetical protein
MTAHELHRLNGCARESVLVAKLLLALDAIDTSSCWPRNGDYIEVPIEMWADVTNARNAAESKKLPEEVQRLIGAIGAVVLSKAYDVKVRAVRVPLETWANILAAKEDVHRVPSMAVAYATEHYIRHGRFPG